MDCDGSRGFAICLRACDLIRELERKTFGVTDAPYRLTLISISISRWPMGKAVNAVRPATTGCLCSLCAQRSLGRKCKNV
jgi:hypothetical protein